MLAALAACVVCGCAAPAGQGAPLMGGPAPTAREAGEARTEPRPYAATGSPAPRAGGPAAPTPAKTAAAPGEPAERPEESNRPADRMKWWREARFGMFVHWGPVSLKGTEIGWSRGGERRGEKGRGPIPVEVYDNLYKQFNPVKFDADEWVRIAKDAGMKYLVFTTKHHDGFVNFDSKLTDYKITSPESPYGRDIVGQLARACHEGGIGLGFYYSERDWRHPDYRTERHARYIEYLHGQLRELCTNYGNVDVIWFDGFPGRAADWDAERLIAMIRGLQPHVIINNRCGVPNDFDTPEQRIGGFRAHRAWETCMTICKQWAWKPNDNMKSLEQCIRTLVSVAGGDGNFLFNVGPMPDGRIEPRQVERLREMGAWLEKYGRSIYATRGGPFKPGAWGASTHRGDRVYIHAFGRPDGGLVLPAIGRKVLGASLLTGGEVSVEETEEGLMIGVPPEAWQEIDTVIELRLDGPAADVAPLAVERGRSGSLAYGKKATASNVLRKKGWFRAEMAFDDDPKTRWATDVGTHAAWIEVDLGKPREIARAVIREANNGRVREFELKRRVDGEWRTFHKGTTLGERAEIRFSPVTARHVRLDILRATDGPTIWEIQLFGPRKK